LHLLRNRTRRARGKRSGSLLGRKHRNPSIRLLRNGCFSY
jgi:hypothetical protein